MIQPVVADLPPSNGKTLLITGITGFVASHLGLLALSKGYSIRGTSRRAKNAQRLVDYAYKRFSSRVEIFEVPDMTIDGSLKEAAQGTSGGGVARSHHRLRERPVSNVSVQEQGSMASSTSHPP